MQEIKKLKNYKWVRVSKFFNEISEIKYNCNTKNAFPGYTGLWCKLIMAVTSYAMTNNSVAVIHGPQNCVWAIRNFKSTNYSLYYGNPFLHMPCTNIDQNDVISGGTEKLINTLIKVDQDYKPESICVFDTCSMALIGDDIPTAINKAQELCSAKINYIPSAGMTAPYLGKAIEETSEKYTDMMEKPDKIIPDTVNILGQYKESFCKKRKRGKYKDDAYELTKYIKALNLNLHRVMICGNPEMIKTATQASINVISCPTWGVPLAKKMKKLFGTPYLKHSLPTGIEATSRWIRELAFFTNRQQEAEKLIQSEIDELLPLFEKTKSLVKGKAALIECGRNSQTAFARPMALARMLQELGMKPYLFGLHPLELKAKKVDIDYFLWDGFDPMILDSNYPYQQPANINEIIESLHLKDNQYIYFTEDVFPLAKAGSFDPSNTPRVESGVHLRRVIDSSGRGIGFSGAKSLYKNIIEALTASKRGSKPTLYGRVHGKFYEYND